MGLSAIADRTVWPPSLSRDRKWPRPPIRRKTRLWMRVTPVAYKIEQSVMGQKMYFSDSYVIFGVRRKNLIICTIVPPPKKHKIFYSRNVKLQSAITPWSTNVQMWPYKTSCYVTWTSQLRTGQPSIFAIQVWRTAYCITCTTKLINMAARLVRAHLDFCTSWGQTQWFLLF